MAKRQQSRGRRPHNAKCQYCGKRHGDGAPWWNKGKNGWSVTIAKGRSRLIAKGWEGHNEAISLWKSQPVVRLPDEPLPIPVGSGEQTTVETICELYLDYVQQTGSPSRYTTVRGYLNNLCYHPRLGMASATVGDLRKGGIARVRQWVDAQSGWNDATKESVYKIVKRAFNYAGDRSEDSLGLFEGSPLARLNTGKSRVKGTPRQHVFDAKQVKALLANSNPSLQLAFEALLATGCRPEEFCTLTANDVRDDAHGRIHWLVDHKNIKKTGAKRRIWLTKRMQEITREQRAKHAEGPLFRNTWDEGWTVDSLLAGMRAVTAREGCRELGLDDHMISKRTNGKDVRRFHYVIYTFRHTYAFRWLTGFYRKKGKPIYKNYGQVAAYMGNSAREVERTYGHLVDATLHLAEGIEHD